MAYVVDEAKVETIARALLRIQTLYGAGTPPDPDALKTLNVRIFMTGEEVSETYGAGPYPNLQNIPAWKQSRVAAVVQYVAMHEMGLI